MDPINVLIIDDEADLCTAVNKVVAKAGYGFASANNGKDGLNLVETFKPDVVLLDMVLPDTDGLVILKQLKQIEPELPVIILTGHETVKSAVETLKSGSFTYMTKPFNNEELELMIRQAANPWLLTKEVRYLRTRMHIWLSEKGIITASDSMKSLAKLVEAVAPTNATVLITGESGTGKELIATAIHKGSSRSNRPFIPIDISTCPETLVESELFGYERGAFTGAVTSRSGKLEMANGGTVFLDEIGNLPKHIQAKLLRVLESKVVERIGGKRQIPIDMRVVVATNIDIKEAVKKGDFKLDLYHRLNEFPVNIPPLRERCEDMPLLIDHFISRYNNEMGKKISGVSSDALAKLEAYHWPGNVRELKNTIKRCMVVADRKITYKDLPAEVKSLSADTTAITANGGGLRGAANEAVAAVEKRLIIETLQKTSGNKGLTAKLLDIDEKTLYNNMKKYEIYVSGGGKNCLILFVILRLPANVVPTFRPGPKSPALKAGPALLAGQVLG